MGEDGECVCAGRGCQCQGRGLHQRRQGAAPQEYRRLRHRATDYHVRLNAAKTLPTVQQQNNLYNVHILLLFVICQLIKRAT